MLSSSSCWFVIADLRVVLDMKLTLNF